MVFECRLKKVTSQHVISSLITILVLYLLDYFSITEIKYLSGYRIGFLAALLVSYLILNSKVRVKVEGNEITVYHSGMVQANIVKELISHITRSGRHNLSRIVILTNDGRKITIPSSCFSDSEIESLMKQLSD
jgi:hypothetical protein